MTGRLIYNHDRPDIAFDTGALYGGLHCGECFRCRIDDQWVPVRLEYMGDWVLIQNAHPIPICYGVRVEI